LHQVVRIAVLDVVFPQPGPDQRRIQLDEPIPTLGFGAATEAVKQTERRFIRFRPESILSPSFSLSGLRNLAPTRVTGKGFVQRR
jgi:hypothetical protein